MLSRRLAGDRGWLAGAAALALAGVLVAVAGLLKPASPPRAEPAAGEPLARVAQPAIAHGASERVALSQGAAGPSLPAAACPFQQIDVSLDSSVPLRACVDSTRVQQNGGVRSYIAAGSGVAAWALQIDVAGGEVVKALLRAGDGRRFACEAPACVGLALSRHDARGLRSITLRGLALELASDLPPAGPGKGDGAARPLARRAVVSGRLAVPADDLLPGLACTGPSLAMNSPDGSARTFCGQGGAGVEMADDGSRHYRFEDAEGSVLSVSVDGEQRITRVAYGGLACSGAACTGASMAALAPERELSERSFFFGRTPLYGARVSVGPGARPQLLLEGCLTLPSQE